MNCFSQEDAGGLEPRPILTRDGEFLNDRTRAEFVANFDPPTGDYSPHLNCSARAWSTLKFSAGHPETGKHPHVSISSGDHAGTKGAVASRQSIRRRVMLSAAVSPCPAPQAWLANSARPSLRPEGRWWIAVLPNSRKAIISRQNAAMARNGGQAVAAASMKTFGEVLAEARKRRGLTLKAVAARVLKDDGKPMSQPYLNDIELGHKGPPADAMLRQLARILGVEIEVLRFYANRVYEKPKGADPAPDQIVAAYRAFRRELDKKRGQTPVTKPGSKRGG
jgi:transcriptional regulator with XRE-family HTH domain